MAVAARLLVCCCALGLTGAIAAQMPYSPAPYAPATAPPSPADVIRQAGPVQSGVGAGQGSMGQGIALTSDGGSLPISLGDLIDVQVFSTPELSGNSLVDQNGDVTLPVGGKVHLAGLDATQAAVVIQDRLKSAQIMIDPHVRVLTLQYASQGVTVLGEVARPGIYTLLGAHTIWQAISAASGLTTNAGKTITIAHHSDPTNPIILPLSSPNYSPLLDTTPVLPGDSVVVARADNFYIVGDVARTGEFPLINGRPNTVLNALALCGGVTRTAKMSRAAIVRTTPTGVTTISIDLDRIMKNKAPNPVLQASDVLVVPRSGGKVFLETFLPTATQTVTSAVVSALILK